MSISEFKKRILVADDDNKIRKFLFANLKSLGYEVQTAGDGEEALSLFEAKKFDLVLLDIMMPKLDGIGTLKKIRAESNVPVLLLTAKGEIEDKVLGLDSGADDYLAKPFALEELFARVRALLRRSETISERLNVPVKKKEFVNGPLVLNLSEQRFWINGAEIHLTGNEFKLLALFMQYKNSIISHEQILHSVWGPESISETQYIRVVVGRLRQKLKKGGLDQDIIRSVSGFRYILESTKSSLNHTDN